MTLSADGRVVIVGGGLAGASLAEALRSHGHTGPIAIVDREPAFYDRPPLSKAALVSGATLEDLRLIPESRLAELEIDAVTGTEAAAIDTERLTVALADGRVLPAEAVVLATGGRARVLPFAGADAPVVRTLRNWADAQAIRAAATPDATVLIVGAGLIGAELASSLRSLGTAVVLVDPVALPLVPAVGERLAGYLHAMHAAHGVDVRVGTLTGVENDGDAAVASLSNGARIPVDLVVVGVGILPNVELAESAGIEVSDGIVVDERWATSAPGVYAIGDVARIRAADGSLARRAEHWEAAQKAGQSLAAVLTGSEPEPLGASWWWSDRYGVHVEGVGRMTGPGEIVVREGGEQPAAFCIDGGLLAGAVSIDDANAVRAARRIIDQRIPVTAEQLADPAVNLRSLLRAAR